MKKINFLKTFLFMIALVWISCSAATVTIQKGSGMPTAGAGQSPIVAIKVMQNNINIIPKEYQLQTRGFEGLIDITNQDFNLDLKPGESIKIFAEVFGGVIPGGGLSYFNNQTDIYYITASENENIVIQINLSNKKVQFQTTRIPVIQKTDSMEQVSEIETEEMTENQY
ncbi:hypothetical protein ACFLYH_00905 [Candidatus Dependentiae bacterium]